MLTSEEQKNMLCDFPMPFRTIDGVPGCFEGRSAIPAKQRPLVHVFLVQESMSADALQVVLDAIHTVVTEAMHPDMQIVLMSFSNRISVYRLSAGVDASCSGSDPTTGMASAQTDPYGGVPSLTDPPHVQQGQGASEPNRVHLSQNRGRCKAKLFGNSMQALAVELQNQKYLGKIVPDIGGYGAGSGTEIAPMRSLESVTRFLDSAATVADAVPLIEAALDDLFDSWQSHSQGTSSIHATNQHASF